MRKEYVEKKSSGNKEASQQYEMFVAVKAELDVAVKNKK